MPRDMSLLSMLTCKELKMLKLMAVLNLQKGYGFK